MNLFKTMCLAVVVLMVSVAVWGDCAYRPVAGVYDTTIGNLKPGRVSEAWCTLPSPGVPGNTQNAESWDGANLGAQWKVYGMSINAAGPQIVGSSMNNGNGWIAYSTDYDGGQFWLSKNHTWGDGVNDLWGTVSNYNVYARITYVNYAPVSVYSTAYFTGVFDECPVCYLEYVISNVAQVWPSNPGLYPALLCGTAGEYFDVCCIRASIFCQVGTEESTWGAIKSLYR